MRPSLAFLFATVTTNPLLLAQQASPPGAEVAAEPSIAQLVAELQPIVEELRGLAYRTPVVAEQVAPRDMMAKMTGGAIGPDSPARPAGGGLVALQEHLRSMQRDKILAAALGMSSRAEARKAVDGNGEVRADPSALFRSGMLQGGGPGHPAGEPPQGLLGAFYEHHGKQIILIVNGSERQTTLRRVLAHEMTHALDDQHYGLDKLQEHGDTAGSPMGGGGFPSDRQLAYTALAEGSAMQVELAWAVRSGQLGSMPRHAGLIDEHGNPQTPAGLDIGKAEGSRSRHGGPDALPIADKLRVFPYAYGYEFVGRMRSREQSLAAVFADPPTTTEQILHPERYVERDLPSTLDLDGARQWMERHEVRQLAARTLGEYGWRLALEHAGSSDAAAAADGWDGDETVAIDVDQRIGLLHASTWDSEADAVAFAAALGSLLDKEYPGGHRVLRTGSEVLALAGVRVGLLEAFVAAKPEALLRVER